jgi:hypothetical protein
MIVVAIAVIRLSPPMADGTNGCTVGGKVSCAKLAVPVTVLTIMSGIVNFILKFLYEQYAW